MIVLLAALKTRRAQKYAILIGAKFNARKLPEFQASNVNLVHSVTYCAADECPVRFVIPQSSVM